MKKLLLTTLNARYTHTCLALYYLRASLADSRIEIGVCEFNINQSRLEILEGILGAEADYIAISVYIWNAREIRSILADIKKLSPGVVIILGGPEVSYQAEKWLLQFPWLDYVVLGAGEGVIGDILQDKAGINKGIVQGKSWDMDELPFPYREMSEQDKQTKYFYYETSRGCPYKCAYCLSSRVQDTLRFRSLDKVFVELEYFIREGYNQIKLVDRTFNASSERARKIWQKILELYKIYPASPTKFHFEIHPELLGSEDFALLQAVPAGRFRFEMGIQSLNELTLRIIGRGMNWEKIRENIIKIRQLGNIRVHLDLIAGLPEEDIRSLGLGFNEVIKLGCGQLQLGFLKVLAGTEMEFLAGLYGILYQTEAPYEVLQTRVMSWGELRIVKGIESMLDIYINSHKYDRTVTAIIEHKGGGAWELLRDLAEYYRFHKIEQKLRDWEKCAEILADYYKSQGIMSLEELLDYLRLDWCNQSRSHYYPAFLRSVGLAKAKERGYRFLKSLPEAKLSSGQMRQAIFFQSVSGVYGRDILVFYGKVGDKEVLRLNQELVE
jgi:hypothetical protein